MDSALDADAAAAAADADAAWSSCAHCAAPTPCVTQGLCVDPVVLSASSVELVANAEDDAEAACASWASWASHARDADGAAYVIEGVVVVRARDGRWMNARVVSDADVRARSRVGVAPALGALTSSSRDDSSASGRMGMTTLELLSNIGCPADVRAARERLVQKGAPTVPHGDHVDFLVGERLVHFADDEHCGRGCAHGGDSAGQVIDHGVVKVLRRRRGGAKGGDYKPLPNAEPKTRDVDVDVRAEDGASAYASEADALCARLALEARGGDEESTHTRLFVDGICCPSEAPLIHKILERMEGVRDVKVVVPTKTVLVEHAASTVSTEAIVDALNGARLQAHVADTSSPSSASKSASEVSGTRDASRLPPARISAACVFFAISLLHYIPDSSGRIEYLRYVALGAVAVGTPQIASKAFGSLKHAVVDINALMTVAIAGACALQDFGEAAAVVALFTLSEWLEARAMAKTTRAIGAVMALRPQTATRVGASSAVPVEDIAVGDIVCIRPGDIVPLDGIVVAGSSAVDESALTGESMPVRKTLGDRVFGGTVNQGGALEARATSIAADSAVARLVRLIEDAQAQRSSSELAIERFARVYTPLVIVGAALVMVTQYALGETGSEPAYLACVLLVIACPCALVLSTPVVAVSALTLCAQRGVLVKGSAHLERLGRVERVFMDKTGTLTRGAFTLSAVRLVCSPKDDTEYQRPALAVGALLRWMCALESKSSHPLASAILRGAGAAIRVAAKQCKVEAYDTIPGRGARATIDGRRVEAGNGELAAENGWLARDAELTKISKKWEAEGGTVIWIGLDGLLAGIVRCDDVMRPNAGEAVEKLHALGVRVDMITGDNAGAAEFVRARVPGLSSERVKASLTPREKLELVKDAVLQAECATSKLSMKLFGRSTVAMVGDGVNDAPALGAADVGIAMGVAGSAAAMETADVSLMTNDLTRVVETIVLGRECVRKIRQNVIFSVVTKLAVLALSIAGRTGLWEAIAVDVGASLLVILNGMSVLRRRTNHAELASVHCVGERARIDGKLDDSTMTTAVAALGAVPTATKPYGQGPFTLPQGKSPTPPSIAMRMPFTLPPQSKTTMT